MKEELEKNITEEVVEETLEEASKESEEQKKEEKEPESLKLMRIQADFTNYKRRVALERAEWQTEAQAEVLRNFLPCIDDVHRGIEAAKKESEDSPLLDGLRLIEKNMKSVLEKMDVKEIDCSKDFNPDFHEALMQLDSPDHESGKIIKVLRPGYLFKDIVLRHSQVSVAQ